MRFHSSFRLAAQPRARLARPLHTAFATAALLGLAVAGAQAADEYWKTDGSSGSTWTSSVWGTTSSGPFTTGWTSGNNAIFTANSSLTFATTAIGNVTVAAGATVTITQGGTLTLSPLISTFDIGTGALLTWQSQNVTANSAAGIIKTGAGTLDLGALTFTTNMSGGFTLNNGTVIVSGDKALGNGSLTLNSGTLQSSGTRAFAATSMTIGGDFALAGTGNANWDAATTIALGSSTRTMTNNTASGSRQFRGLISGASGAGLTFAGTGSGQIYIGNTGNTFSGPVAVNGGEVLFNDNGTFGTTTSITIDGGRLTIASMNTGGTSAAITAATIASSRNIFVGSTAGTAVSIQGATGVTTYNGVIADKTASMGILVKQGAGRLVLGGVSTYSGQTSINNGTVQLTTGNDRLPTGTVVNLGQSASSNLGTLDLNGNSQTIAGLTSTTGTNATATTNVVTSGGAATLTINATGSNSYLYSTASQANSGIISGALSLIKTGSGTQTLGGANTYTGTTTINGGTLVVAGSLASTAVSLSNANSTLASGANSTSSIAGAVTAGNGTFITPGGAGTVGTVTLGSLTMNGGSTLNLDILGNSTFDKIVTSGVLTLGAGTETVNIAGSGFTAGTFTLLSGYSSLAGGMFTLGSTPGGFVYSLATGATSTVLTVAALGGGGNLTWSLNGAAPTSATDGAGTWINGGTNFYNTGVAAATTWDNTANNHLTVGSGGTGGVITLGSNVRVGGLLTFATVTTPYTIGAFGGTNTLTLAGGLTANNSATIMAAAILEASQTWNVATGTLTVNGAVNETGGSKILTKSGAGILVLTNTSSSYSGGTIVSGGVLNVGSDASLGAAAGGLSLGSGTLQTSAGITSARSLTLNSGGGIFDTNGFNSTWSGQIGGTGALAKNNGGTLTLSHTGNNYSGGTTINGGTLLLAAGSATGAGNVTVQNGATLAGAGTVNGTTTVNSGTINGSGLTLTGVVTFNGSGNTVSGTVTSSSGNTLTASSAVSTAGTLTSTGAAVVFAVSGNDATLTNLGTIDQTGTGRAIRDTTGVTGFVINNGSVTNSTAVIQTANADVIQMNVSGGSVILNNYGTMTALNSSGAGGQVVDFNAIQSGSNAINNFSTGILQSFDADAVRPGVNGVINNAGLIKSMNSGDGIDTQSNTGVVITNAGTGTIDAARHGVTGGATNDTATHTISITNQLGGTIRSNDGSGINLDGFNANQTATIVNHGTITGNGVTQDGDGLDVDGLVNLTNTGTIRSLNAFSSVEGAFSEGISAGGGAILNSGTIEGLVAVGNTNALGRGISIVGNDSLVLPGTREAIYGTTVITNQSGGLIRGQSDSGIFVGGPASGFTVTITNQAGATIRGGGATTAAIQTGADNDTVNNLGTIIADSSGKGIHLGAGHDTLNILGGSASVTGSISGGTGTNALTVDPGAGNTFSYSGEIAEFATVEVKSGTVNLSGANTYAGMTTISGGTLKLDNDGTTTFGKIVGSASAGAITVNNTGTLLLGGAGSADRIDNSAGLTLAGGTLSMQGLSNSSEQLGMLTLSASSTLDFGIGDGNTLVFSGLTLGGNILSIYHWSGSSYLPGGSDTGAPASQDRLIFTSDVSGESLSQIYFYAGGSGSALVGYGSQINFGNPANSFEVVPVPEPTTILAGLALLGLAGWRERRRLTALAVGTGRV